MIQDTNPSAGVPNAAVVVPGSGGMIGIDQRFQDFTKIGAGGVGTVYRCFDQERKHWVALKQLRLNQSNRKEDREHFLAEPRWMAEFDSPLIPKVYEVFPERMVKPYFTMELIEGDDLRSVLRELRQEYLCVTEGDDTNLSSFSLNRLVTIWLKVCDALAVAHQQNVIHADVKPENIMVTDSDEVRLIDWGSAASFELRDGESETELQADRRSRENGLCFGSPLYMAPEQVLCNEGLDNRVDVYSASVVLYDLLALQTMISGQTRNELLHQVVRGPRIRPSQKGLRPSIPRGIEDACMKAVSISPSQRYESIQAMSQSVRCAMSDTPTEGE